MLASSHTSIQRFISAVLIYFLTVTPVVTQAASDRESAVASGQLGFQLGEAFADAVPTPSTNADGSFSLGTIKNDFGEEVPVNIQASQLFPGDKPENQFPGEKEVDIEAYKRADHDYLQKQGAEYQSALYMDAVKDNPSTTMGAAYKVIMDSANSSRPDFRNDPDFDLSREQLAYADTITEEFSDCSLARQVQQVSQVARVPDYKTCERITDESEECTIRHNYSTSVLELNTSTNFNLTHGTDGNYFLGWIGRVGDNYWSGNCVEKFEYTTFRVVNPEAITKATIVYGKWDDHMEIYIGPAGEETMVWRGPYDYFPLDDNGVPNGQRCELKTSWEWNLNVDVTPYFKDVKVGDSVRFMIRAAVDGGGEAYARLRIDYDPTKVLSRDEWIPSSETCISSAKSTLDEMVDGGYECVDMPQLDANGCSNENGVIVCPSDMKEPPIDIHPLCKEVKVDARFDFYHGQAECFIDRNGDEVCPVVEKSKERGEISSCKKYEEDPQCRFFSEECVEGAEGETGRCYVKSETWDCGEDVSYTDYESNEEIQCDGTFLCQGSECGIKPKTESTSFAKAATLLQASQFMQMDANCEEFSTETNNICEVFAGTDYECKRLAGGVVDCCDQPVEVTPAHYIRMMATVGVMEASFSMIDPSLPFGQAQGAYNALRDPIASSLSELTKPFTSAVETVTGPIKDATSEYLTEPVGNFLADLKAKASEQFAKFFAKEGATGAGAGAGAGAGSGGTEAATNAAVEQGAAEAGGALATAGNIMATVMGVYSAVMLAYLAIQIIFECTEDEIELAVKRELKACTYVGTYCKSRELGICLEYRKSYCCYNSPLSRIVMEQATPQLGRTYGSKKDPQCSGIMTDELERLDWSQMDLTEWTGLLQQQGAMISPSDYNLDNLTGSGHPNNMPEQWGNRDDSLTRLQDRLETGSVDDARIEKAQNFPYDPT